MLLPEQVCLCIVLKVTILKAEPASQQQLEAHNKKKFSLVELPARWESSGKKTCRAFLVWYPVATRLEQF